MTVQTVITLDARGRVDEMRPASSATKQTINKIQGTRMMKMHRLSLLATLILAACGGSDDDSSSADTTPPAATVTLKGRALVDEYLAEQTVCLDLDADQQCDTPESKTDQQGYFSITLPEEQRDEATQAWVMVNEAQTGAVARTSTPTSTLLGYFDGNTFTVSPYTHQLVTSADPDLRKTQYQTSIATKTKVEIAGELGLSSQEMNEQKLFGDYLVVGNEQSAELGQEAAIKHEQQSEAAQLQAKLIADLAINNPEGWQSVTVSIRNFWQHSFHLQKMQHVQMQEIKYAKRENDIETTQTEGISWLLDEQDNPLDIPLHHFTAEIRKNWSNQQLREYSSWEYDYDQDGTATFKGEMAAAGSFAMDENGLSSRNAVEFFNEGNPADEGADNRPDHIYCEDFDIQGEMDKWLANKNGYEVSHCVSFVETRQQSEQLENNGDLVSKDIMTEWKGPDDVHSNWLVNLETDPDYHEPRTEIITVPGDVQRITQYDWQALSINFPELAQQQPPFNVVRDESQRHNGEEATLIAQPLWAGSDTLGFKAVDSVGRVELQNYNPTSWGSLATAYLEQDYLEKTNTYALDSRFYRLDQTKPEGFNELNLKYAGESEPFMTQSWEYNESNLTLKATHTYRALEGEIANVQPAPGAVMQGEPMTLDTTIRLEQTGDLDTATQSTQIDGGKMSEAPTFAQGIMTSNLSWNIATYDPASYELVELLFGPLPMQFVASRDLGNQTACYGNNLPTKILQELLFAPVGGDMIVTISCQWEEPWWNREKQYLLRMTEAYNGSRFSAELLEFDYGANIYRDAPKNRYPLSFTKAP